MTAHWLDPLRSVLDGRTRTIAIFIRDDDGRDDHVGQPASPATAGTG